MGPNIETSAVDSKRARIAVKHKEELGKVRIPYSEGSKFIGLFMKSNKEKTLD